MIQSYTEALRAEKHRLSRNGSQAERFLGCKIDGETFVAPLRLACEPVLWTAESTLMLHDIADWTDVNPHLQAFAAKFCDVAKRKFKIPLYIAKAQPRALRVGHAEYGLMLSPQEFLCVCKIGRSIAQKLGGHVQPGQHPSEWVLKQSVEWPGKRGLVLDQEGNRVYTRKTPGSLRLEYRGLF